jgi:predicted ATP-dependent protease
LHRFKESFSPDFFSTINFEQSFDRYFDLPKKIVGRVNGLALYGDDSRAVLFPVQSELVYLLDPLKNNEYRFELLDAKSGLATEVTMKGFERVSLFMLKYLQPAFEVLRKQQWKVSSEIYDEWDPVDGPSASMAAAISIISAMSDTPLYKNRFVTGALSPGGKANIIGGTYWKGMVPMRLKELAMQKDNEPTYFVFPAANLTELTKDLVWDAFDLTKKVGLLPVSTIAEAYHYLTTETITKDDILHAEELGKQDLLQSLDKIIKRFSEPAK